jgi:hypothetical protein
MAGCAGIGAARTGPLKNAIAKDATAAEDSRTIFIVVISLGLGRGPRSGCFDRPYKHGGILRYGADLACLCSPKCCFKWTNEGLYFP